MTVMAISKQKENEGGNITTEKLVLQLMKSYLLKAIFSSWITNSVSLSEKLVKLKAHTNGAIRPNRRNPKDRIKK